MVSQTSTNKFNDDGNKINSTNQSANLETLEFIGGTSIELPENLEQHKKENILKTNNTKVSCNAEVRAVIKTTQNSKLEEGNSSIGQPSIQTEQEANFLWNKSKIEQNSLGPLSSAQNTSSVTSPGKRSQTGIRQSLQ